jgi:hypothetical protein
MQTQPMPLHDGQQVESTAMTAFRATYADWKLIKTRGVVQVVMEIPLADADAAYDVLGGMPVHGKERWFGIAAMKSPVQKEAAAKPRQISPPDAPTGGAKRNWRDIPPPQQAGIRCDEPAFGAYLKENHPDEWHETGDADACLKMILRIESKTELKTDPRRMMLWHQLDNAYQAWKALEHA